MRALELPPRYFPPENYLVSGTSDGSKVFYNVMRKSDRKSLPAYIVDGAPVPDDFTKYFDECLESVTECQSNQ